MNYLRKGVAVFLLVVVPLLAKADNGSQVVVVYNTKMPGSKTVAEHYAKMRQVPQKQIFGFALTTNEVMSRREFRDTLQLPLAEKLESRGLWKFGSTDYPATNGQPARTVQHVVASKIRYAVLCYGVPLKIAPDPSLHEATAEKIQPALRKNEAAVDSELTWLPLVKMDFPLIGPFPNWLYGATNADELTPTNGILLVTRLDGPSEKIANGLVDKAMEAESNGLWGRAYFDARGLAKTDTNYYLGDEWILGAAQIAQQLGYETTVNDKPETFPASFPMSHIAIYCGWYAENACGPFALPKVEFMPGAFAYHLQSYSAATLRSTSQHWCGPLLAKGVTATMGCVYEPYLGGTPNIAEFLHLFGAGYTYGEAAWAAQPMLSWQTTVIGDPLYRPFGTSPQALHFKLLREHSPLVQWSYLRLVDLGLARGAPMIELSGLLERLDETTNSAVLTEKLAGLYDAEGKPSSAIDYYQQALKLNPSPEQRIRIRLTLGKKLQAQNRDAEAIEDYQKLLAESPDYPGKNFISEKITALEQKSTGTNSPSKS